MTAHLSASASVEEIVEVMARDGFAVVEGLYANHVETARADLRRVLDETPLGRNDFEGHKTRRVYALFAKTRAMDAAALHPTLRSAEQSNQLRGELHRHGAASHVASVASRGPHFSAQTAALGAFVVVLVAGIIAGALYWGTRGTEEQRVDSALASSDGGALELAHAKVPTAITPAKAAPIATWNPTVLPFRIELIPPRSNACASRRP